MPLLKQPQRMGAKPQDKDINTLQALGMMGIPGFSDGMGLAGDLKMFLEQPQQRTAGNYGLAALGMLPLVPGAAGKLGKKAGDAVEKIKGKKSIFNREIEIHPNGLKLVNVDVKPKHAKLLSELSHDFALDNNGISPLQVMGSEKGRVRIRIPDNQIDAFAEYVEDYIFDKNRGSKLPEGIKAAVKALFSE